MTYLNAFNYELLEHVYLNTKSSRFFYSNYFSSFLLVGEEHNAEGRFYFKFSKKTNICVKKYIMKMKIKCLNINLMILNT